VFSRIAHFFALLAAVQLLGGHWLALQSMAWVGMAISYSQGSSVTIALQKTFDGEHPCALCKVVKKGRSEEQKKESAKIVVKIEAVLAATLQAIQRETGELTFALLDERSTARPLTPATPPPLLA
jgi:hypothetical protein